MIELLQSPQWAGVLARVLAMNSVRRLRALAKIRKWWMKPIFIQRREAGNKLLDVIMQEQVLGATLSFLRMDIRDFHHLLELVEPLIRKSDTNMRRAITTQERLLIGLRYVATGDCFGSLKYLFRVSKRSIGRIITEVCAAIIEVLQEYVQLPSTTDEWLRISKEFETRWKFPHAIGAVDGKHVRIQAPKNSGTEYFNYRRFHSIVLLAVCDANYNFLYADVGCQGRISDGGVFKNCSLRPLLENNSLNIPAPQVLSLPYSIEVPYVLLGDKAFGMTEYLIRPFSGMHARGTLERTFNTRHSSARGIIENTLGIHSSRFRVLEGPIPLAPEKVKVVVLATVYLHNFLRNRHSAPMYMPPESTDREVNGRIVHGTWRTDIGAAALTGLAGIRVRSSQELRDMRMRFADYFMNF